MKTVLALFRFVSAGLVESLVIFAQILCLANFFLCICETSLGLGIEVLGFGDTVLRSLLGSLRNVLVLVGLNNWFQGQLVLSC